MSGVWAIARRDLASTFLVPTGWILLSVWGLIATAVFLLVTLIEGQPATLRAVVSVAGWALIVVAPAISMRSFAEESRQGTLEILLSAPVSPLELVLGKLLAAVAVLASLAVPVLGLAAIAELYGDPDPGELATGLLGLLLFGTSMLSIGILVSTRTASQVVAYLVTLFVWVAVVLASKGGAAILPQLLDPMSIGPDRVLAWMTVIQAADPMIRLEEFAIGLFDSANVLWFLAVTAAFVAFATVSISAARRPRASTSSGRFVAHATTVFGVVGWIVACVAIGRVSTAPGLRVEADLTKTRAYSLRPATETLLRSLEPGWTLRMLVAEDETDPVTMRLVDEVVARMDSASDSFSAERIDPVDPASIDRYTEILESLVADDRVTIDLWMDAIDRGRLAFESLRALDLRLGPSIDRLLPELPEDGSIRDAIERVRFVLATLASEGGAFTDFLDESLRATSERPLPNWRLARASLAANNGKYADELEQLADVFRQWTVNPGIPMAVRNWARDAGDEVEDVAAELRATATDLETLEVSHPLTVAVLAEAMLAGDVAILSGPAGSTVIPGWQLFPATAVTGAADRAVIGFDRRFQGEEMLTGAIRSLRTGRMPRVVVVHAEERSMLRAREDGLEVASIADALRTARYEVEEWIPGRTDRPLPDPDRVTVWFVVPPLQRSGLEYGDGERALLDATSSLIAEGEPVLVTVARSMLPLVGQPDPWATIADDLGVEVRTGDVIFEWAPELGERGAVRTWQTVTPVADANAAGHPVGGALRGKQLLASHVTPIRAIDDASNVAVIAEVPPGPLRWIERDWRGDGATLTGPPADGMLETAVPLAVAVDATGPDGGPRRAVVVGTGGWALSAIVNEAATLGGDRIVLANPGNRELALSGIAWLAGLDELVATAASGREVSRFQGVTGGGRAFWAISLPLVLGLGPLALGATVWSTRRRAS